MSTCESCPLQDGCYEKRGLCRDYILYMERVEKVREQIEKLNENKEKVTGRSGADKGGIQEAGNLQQLEAHESGRNSERVQTEACANPETEDSSEKTDGAEKRV